MQELQRQGFTRPTPIQMQAIPVAMYATRPPAHTPPTHAHARTHARTHMRAHRLTGHAQSACAIVCTRWCESGFPLVPSEHNLRSVHQRSGTPIDRLRTQAYRAAC